MSRLLDLYSPKRRQAAADQSGVEPPHSKQSGNYLLAFFQSNIQTTMAGKERAGD